MWKKSVDVFYEPHCEEMSEELQVVVPVCRDKLREKSYRMYKWRKEGWDFEKLETSVEKCKPCEEPPLKEILEKFIKW